MTTYGPNEVCEIYRFFKHCCYFRYCANYDDTINYVKNNMLVKTFELLHLDQEWNPSDLYAYLEGLIFLTCEPDMMTFVHIFPREITGIKDIKKCLDRTIKKDDEPLRRNYMFLEKYYGSHELTKLDGDVSLEYLHDFVADKNKYDNLKALLMEEREEEIEEVLHNEFEVITLIFSLLDYGWRSNTERLSILLGHKLVISAYGTVDKLKEIAAEYDSPREWYQLFETAKLSSNAKPDDDVGIELYDFRFMLEY